MSLRAFGDHVRSALPDHFGATRLAGDLDRPVRTVALCGGSGDFLMGAASSAGADVYVTSDLKHHAVSEHLERADACAIVDVPHWAAEWTWLPVLARDLLDALPGTVEVRVSTRITDPWTSTLGSTEEHALNADPADQLVLLDLAAVDATIAQLTHRRSSMPLLAQAADLQRKVAAVDSRRIAADTRVQDLERDRRKADAEVELVKTRRQRDEERLNSGAVRNPKDLASLQHELVALERRIGTLEDAELEIMEQLEQAQGELDAALAELEAARTEHDDTQAQVDTTLAEIDVSLGQARSERDALAQRVPDALEELYEKVRARSGGLGAAMLRAKRCEGCRLELNHADLREIVAEPADAVVRCPECSRILVRTAESGL